jgi:uncharacterized delta-60 repeat protein
LTFSFIIKFGIFPFFIPFPVLHRSNQIFRSYQMKQLSEIPTRISFLKIARIIISLSIILTALLTADSSIYGQPRKPDASLALAGIDPSFAPRLEYHGFVSKTFSQPDGKITVIGSFDRVGNTERKDVVRLDADGTPDAPVNLPENVSIQHLTPLPNGKFISLTNNGVIVRLNSDGSLDYGFNFARVLFNPASVAFKARSDGKMFVYGQFKVKKRRLSIEPVIAENLIVLDEVGGIESGYTIGALGLITNVTFLPGGKTAVCGTFEVKRDGITVGRNFAVLDEHGIIDRNFDVVFEAGPVGTQTVRDVVVQPDGKLLVYGHFKTAYKQNGMLRTVSKNKGIVRLNGDGSFDRDFSLPFFSAALAQTLVQPDGKIILYGGLQVTPGVYYKVLCRLFPDGSLDNLFNDNMPVTWNGNFMYPGEPEIKLQPDGKILLSGHLSVNNSPNIEKLVRLNTDGTRDPSFQTSPILGGGLAKFHNLPDGKILICGFFGKIGNRTHIGLARLNADGSTDEAFRFDTVKADEVNVKTLNLLADGKILIAGDFTVVGGEYVYNAEQVNNVSMQSFGAVVRLNQDGSRDDSFAPFTNVFSEISSLAFQPDGKILISGTVWNSPISTYVVRLNADGTVDAGFNRTLFKQSNADPLIADIAVQADGKILVGGYFFQIGNLNQYKLARLNQDGTLDETFSYNGYYHHIDLIRKIVVQPDGKILVGGDPLGSADNAPGLARFNRDGTLDAAFKWNRDLRTTYTYDLQTLPDGKILFAGSMGFQIPGNTLPRDLYLLNRNGEVETRYNLSQVSKFLMQADAKIVAQVTDETTYTTSLKRVFPSGGTDDTFNFTFGSGGSANKLVRQTDGKILVAGNFRTINGVRQSGLARLNP